MYGNLSKIDIDKSIYVCYGEKNIRDSTEVKQIYDKVSSIPLEKFSSHGSIYLANFENIEPQKLYSNLFSIAPGDDAFLTNDVNKLTYDEFIELHNKYKYLKEIMPIFAQN